MLSFLIVGILVLLGALAAAIYLFGIHPARTIEQWSAGLSNGGHFPDRPNVKWLWWLISVHQEMQRIKDKLVAQQKKIAEHERQWEEREFLDNYVMASLIEGVLVVDGQGIITLVNAEFMNVFQLTQSPLRRTVAEAVRDQELQRLIGMAMISGRVQSGRLTPMIPEKGRPPAMEVSVVPIRTRDDQVKGGAIVLIMTPADRARLARAIKRHSLRLDNLVSELLLTSRGGRESIQLKKEPLDVRELLENVVSVFASKPKNSEIKADWKVEGDLPRLCADASYLELGLVRLLDNVTADLGEPNEVRIMAEPTPEGIVIRVTFLGGSLPEEDFSRAFSRPLPPSDASEPPIVGSTSGLSLVREVMDLHGASLSVSSQERQIEIVLTFPNQAKLDAPNRSVPIAG